MKYTIPTLLSLKQGSHWEHCGWTSNIDYCKRQSQSSQRKPGLSEKPVNSSNKKPNPTSSTFHPRKIAPKKARPRARSQTFSKERPHTPIAGPDGFAQFLRTHSSPTHQRVTAGGKIVPMAHSQDEDPFSGSGMAEWSLPMEDRQAFMNMPPRTHGQQVYAQYPNPMYPNPMQQHYPVPGVQPSQIPIEFSHATETPTAQEYDQCAYIDDCRQNLFQSQLDSWYFVWSGISYPGLHDVNNVALMFSCALHSFMVSTQSMPGSIGKTVQALQDIEVCLGFLLHDVGRKIALTVVTDPRDRDQRIVLSLARQNIHQAMDYAFSVGWTPYRPQLVNVPIQFGRICRQNTGGPFHPHLHLQMAANFIGRAILYTPGQRYLPVSEPPMTSQPLFSSQPPFSGWIAYGRPDYYPGPLGTVPGWVEQQVHNPPGLQSAEQWVNEVRVAAINDGSTPGRRSLSQTAEWVENVARSTIQGDDSSSHDENQVKEWVNEVPFPADDDINFEHPNYSAPEEMAIPADGHAESFSHDQIHDLIVSSDEGHDKISLRSGNSDIRRLMACLDEVVNNDAEVSPFNLNNIGRRNFRHGTFDGACDIDTSPSTLSGQGNVIVANIKVQDKASRPGTPQNISLDQDNVDIREGKVQEGQEVACDSDTSLSILDDQKRVIVGTGKFMACMDNVSYDGACAEAMKKACHPDVRLHSTLDEENVSLHKTLCMRGQDSSADNSNSNTIGHMELRDHDGAYDSDVTSTISDSEKVILGKGKFLEDLTEACERNEPSSIQGGLAKDGMCEVAGQSSDILLEAEPSDSDGNLAKQTMGEHIKSETMMRPKNQCWLRRLCQWVKGMNDEKNE